MGLADDAKGLASKLGEKGVQVHANLVQAVTNAARRIERDVKQSMRNTVQVSDDALTPAGNRMGHWVGKGPGRGHRSRSGRKWHASSAPGNAPAMDGGRLAASYTHEVEGTKAIVGSKSVTAPWLEFGTSKMAPRPALGPAVERAKAKFKDEIKLSMPAHELEPDHD